MSSPLLPQEVEYFALTLSNGVELNEPVPLLLNLHGGGGSRDALRGQQPMLEALWHEQSLPPMIVATPSTARSFYIDFHDGSQMWESFLVGPFLQHLRERFKVRTDTRGTMITGISMGGMGALRLAFKHPDIFGAVAALEPGIEPAHDWDDVRFEQRFYRDDEFMESIFGTPIDRDYWSANNPATIVERRGKELRESGLKTYLEAGDEDVFWLYEGAEFLHRTLWQQKIRHEYRLYYGADHVGNTLTPRTIEAYRFLASTIVDREPDPTVEAVRQHMETIKRTLQGTDHYGVDAHLLDDSGES